MEIRKKLGRNKAGTVAKYIPVEPFIYEGVEVITTDQFLAVIGIDKKEIKKIRVRLDNIRVSKGTVYKFTDLHFKIPSDVFRGMKRSLDYDFFKDFSSAIVWTYEGVVELLKDMSLDVSIEEFGFSNTKKRKCRAEPYKDKEFNTLFTPIIKSISEEEAERISCEVFDTKPEVIEIEPEVIEIEPEVTEPEPEVIEPESYKDLMIIEDDIPDSTKLSELPRLFWNDTPVILTSYLAKGTNSSSENIRQKYKLGKEKNKYIDGTDFFYLKGEDLTKFKGYVRNHHLPLSETLKNTSHLYLWTESGALLLASSIGTKEAVLAMRSFIELFFMQKKALQQNNEYVTVEEYQSMDSDSQAIALFTSQRREKLKDIKIRELKEYVEEAEPKVEVYDNFINHPGGKMSVEHFAACLKVEIVRDGEPCKVTYSDITVFEALRHAGIFKLIPERFVGINDDRNGNPQRINGNVNVPRTAWENKGFFVVDPNSYGRGARKITQTFFTNLGAIYFARRFSVENKYELEESRTRLSLAKKEFGKKRETYEKI